MEEILHQLIGSLSHYLQGFIHPNGGCLGFLTVNYTCLLFVVYVFQFQSYGAKHILIF